MSDARDRILTRLRQTRPTGPLPDAPRPPIPPWDTTGMVRRFTERMEAVRAEVHPAGTGDWPAVLADLVAARGVNTLLYGVGGPLSGLLEQQFAKTDQPALVPYAEPVETWKERLFFDTDAAVTSSLAGIAETGSLVLWPTAEEPRLMSLVPPVHFAVLESSRLFPTFSSIVEREGWAGRMPTNALLISGPSKSADIEQTLAYGVHGPKELVVLLVSG